MVKICIECSGNNKAWVHSRSHMNQVHTDFCNGCDHRREVIIAPPNYRTLWKLKTHQPTAAVCNASENNMQS